MRRRRRKKGFCPGGGASGCGARHVKQAQETWPNDDSDRSYASILVIEHFDWMLARGLGRPTVAILKSFMDKIDFRPFRTYQARLA